MGTALQQERGMLADLGCSVSLAAFLLLLSQPWNQGDKECSHCCECLQTYPRQKKKQNNKTHKLNQINNNKTRKTKANRYWIYPLQIPIYRVTTSAEGEIVLAFSHLHSSQYFHGSHWCKWKTSLFFWFLVIEHKDLWFYFHMSSFKERLLINDYLSQKWSKRKAAEHDKFWQQPVSFVWVPRGRR